MTLSIRQARLLLFNVRSLYSDSKNARISYVQKLREQLASAKDRYVALCESVDVTTLSQTRLRIRRLELLLERQLLK
jgi:hypothetical protein